jgi:hypothetical protein
MRDQAWYWTEEHQAGEAEADAQAAEGHGDVYPDGQAFLAALTEETSG